VFWIVGGVLVHQTLGYVECGGVGRLKGGLSECHELKAIEIIAWIIAASSILITIPIVMGAMRRQKHKVESGQTQPQRSTWWRRLALKTSSPGRRAGGSSVGSVTHGQGLMSEKHTVHGQQAV
jgi:hypothetical protein